MEAYALESVDLRARKTAERSDGVAAVARAAVECSTQDAWDRIGASSRRLLASLQQRRRLRFPNSRNGFRPAVAHPSNQIPKEL